eukprot:CAMPEP_0113591206 /NCGR_PEP_ID=MMETSP0015_2-20120614/37135_1 /TAXON_ID=2838 /ORGANISM="Odontella" /LENGTH=181 /DNA_ID=CAMNT_0000497551 /DNA_START=93 /DNA_END=638 /DNA_ORIENTATION=- /assembly_acc=CAM_ASM_000160
MSREKEQQWSIELNLREQDLGYSLLQQCPAPPGMKRVQALEKQFESDNVHGGTGSSAEKNKQALAIVAKKRAKAMSIAQSPGKQMLIKNLNIFSISITSMAVMNPLKSLVGLNNTFKAFEDPDGKVDLQMPKIIFLGLNLIWLMLGLYKMSIMRLIPTTSSDFAGSVVWKELMEMSSIPPS